MIFGTDPRSVPGSDPKSAGDRRQRPQDRQQHHHGDENHQCQWYTDFYVINEPVTAWTHDEDIRRM